MKKIAFLLFSIFFLFSCNQDDRNINSDSILNDEIVVLKERTTPWIESDYKSKVSANLKSSTKTYQGLSHRNYLGYSFKNDIYPIEDTRNLGNQVVDIAKLNKDYPNYLRSWKNNTGEATYYSYATFDRYTSNSTITKNVNGGFNLNLGLFSIGNRTNTKSVFTTTLVEDKNTTFGELNIVVRDSIHRMQYSTEIQNKIKTRYLVKDFEDELYNTHPTEFFKNYGGFVLAEFIVGGKATAIYGGTYKKTESSETKEKNMDTEMNASYGFKYKGEDGKGNVSGDLKLGRNTNSSTSVTNEFTSIMMAIKTIGGNSSFASFSVPKEVKNTEVNLSGWVSSLSDKNTHSIVEFGNGGLIPISDLIVERNLQNQIIELYKTGVNSFERLKEPYISIENTFQQGVQVYVIASFLHTRFGNRIGLQSKRLDRLIDDDFTERKEKFIKEESERLSKMFGVKIIRNNVRSRVSTEQPKTYFDYNFFNEKDLRKFTYDGTIYIVSNYVITESWHPAYMKKFALSIHNNRIIDEYGLKDLLNRLPSITLNYEDFIRDYIIDAL